MGLGQVTVWSPDLMTLVLFPGIITADSLLYYLVPSQDANKKRSPFCSLPLGSEDT